MARLIYTGGKEMANIKWRKKDLDEVTKRVRAFNASITRAEKKYPDFAAIQPKRITVADIKAKITTRAEFNREMKALQRYNIQTAKPKLYSGGLLTTEWQAKEARRLTNLVNRQRAKERKKLPQDLSLVGLMGSEEEIALRPKPLNLKTMTNKGFERFLMGVEKQSRDAYMSKRLETYKENYLKTILNELGGFGYELYDYIEGIEASKMMVSYYEDPLLQIGYLYTLEEAYYVAQRALERWKERLEK